MWPCRPCYCRFSLRPDIEAGQRKPKSSFNPKTSLTAVRLGVWSPDQQHHPKACWKCQLPGPTPALLNEKVCFAADSIFPWCGILLNQLEKVTRNFVVVNSYVYLEGRITNEVEDLGLLEAIQNVYIWFSIIYWGFYITDLYLNGS